MTLITAAWLRERKACRRQVADFEREWPEGAELTKENLLRAAALSLDLDWFAEEILPEPAQSAFGEATAGAWQANTNGFSRELRAYNEALDAAWQARAAAYGCQADAEPAELGYDEATARADRAYDEATSAAVRIFHDAQARALWRIIKHLDRDDLEVGDA